MHEQEKVKVDLTQEQLDKWDAALRSGKFVQGTGRLKRPEYNGTFSYCCLGVLQEVCHLKTTSPYYLTTTEVGNLYHHMVIPEGWQRKLGQKNDDGFDFVDIAEYIKENFVPSGKVVEA